MKVSSSLPIFMRTLSKVVDVGEQVCHFGPCHSKAIKPQPVAGGTLNLPQIAPMGEPIVHLSRWQRC